MNTFFHSFTEGMFHIFCLDAIDHILFLLALVARFDFTKLKYVFWMVTAFTIGHAITFMLAALGKFYDVRSMAEMAIPATIAITAIYNMFSNHKWGRSFSVSFIAYVLALFFGSIHGLAIGSMLRMKLINGHFITQLVGYNLGIEFAQIAVVLGILITQFFIMGMFKVKQEAWRIGASGVALGCSVMMLLDKLAS